MESLQTQDQRIIKIKIDFQQEIEQHQISLKENQDTSILYNYDKIRKKILQTYKYMANVKNQIQLTITNFYRRGHIQIPIHHDKNYMFLVNDMISRGLNTICIKVIRLKELTKRKQREKQAPIQFDSDGSVQSVEDQRIKEYVNANRPKCKPYQNKQMAVRCIFCHQSSKSQNQSKIAGPFYGPFIKNSYAHLLCLLWCGQVFVNEQFELCGVEIAIPHRQKIKCNYCRQKGASFYCHREQCRKAAHYKCASKNDWYFDWSQYQSYCPSCKEPYIYKYIAIEPQLQSNSLFKPFQAMPKQQNIKMQ